MRDEQKKINRAHLAEAIYDIFEEFRLIKMKPRTGKAHKIVSIIIAAMTEALQRGESVKIDGFGIFKRYTRQSRLRSVSYFPTRLSIVTPPRTFVKFYPSKVLTRLINEDQE